MYERELQAMSPCNTTRVNNMNKAKQNTTVSFSVPESDSATADYYIYYIIYTDSLNQLSVVTVQLVNENGVMPS